MVFSFFLIVAHVQHVRATNDSQKADLPPASLKVPESAMDMQRVPVNVSFYVGEDKSALNMAVSTGPDENIECLGLADDVNDVTEVRAADGESFETLHGGGGSLLQSSQSGIECRVHVRGSSGAPYTVADVPHPPGFLSAYIVLPSGHFLEIQRDNVTDAYVSLTPQHLPSTHRRQLQSFIVFKCAVTPRKNLKLGIIVDEAYLAKFNDNKRLAMEGIKQLWRECSVPFEKQFNIKLLASRILFHDDPLLSQESKWLKCGDTRTGYHQIARWRNTKRPDEFAAWILVIGCEQVADAEGVSVDGVSSEDSLAERLTTRTPIIQPDGTTVQMWFGSVATAVGIRHNVAHEIGHLFGARHTFGAKHKKKQGDGYGIMDYAFGDGADVKGIGKDFLFERMHQDEMCKVVGYVLSKSVTKPTSTPGYRQPLVAYNQRWGPDTTTTPTTPRPTPSTTAPQTTPSTPSTPSTPTTTASPSAPSPSPSTTSASPSTPSPTLDGAAEKDGDTGSMIYIYIVVGIACFFALLSAVFLWHRHHRKGAQGANPTNVREKGGYAREEKTKHSKDKAANPSRHARQAKKMRNNQRSTRKIDKLPQE